MIIRQLPQDVVDKIKSSVNITSLNGVVCGLVTNSLDAGASKINISIDYSRGNCTVEDNGSGIPPEEFTDSGGLGKLHHTSKFPSRPSVHGKQGDFLASLATLSLLTVTSRHHRHVSHNSVSIHNSQVLARQLPSPPESRLVNFDHGTRTTVRDLFGTMPVRVKQRATLSERSAVDKEWSKLIRVVIGLLLAWPSGISVSLKNIATARELRLRPSERTDMVSKVSRMLTQAGLADSSDADAWVPISASCGSVSATCYGFLKKQHFRPRKVQLAPDESLLSTAKILGRPKKPSNKQSKSTNSSGASSVTSLSRSNSIGPRTDSPFEGWHRVKVGRATPHSATSKAVDVRTKMREKTPMDRLVGEGGRLLRKPFDEPSPEPEDYQINLSADDSNSDSVMRTADHETSNSDTAVGVPLQSTQKRDEHHSKWLQGVVSSWENPIFQPVQPSIPYIDCSAPDHSRSYGRGGYGSINVELDTGTMSVTGRISRQALSRATVVAQVDRKFILVKLPLENAASQNSTEEKQSSSLVMLDQHAVDERCQLEGLMADYFTLDPSTDRISPAIELLDRPIIFEVSREEWSLLEQYSDYFATWGILYQTPPSSHQNKVVVAGLPPSIIERCRLEPRLLIELLRTEVWRSVDSSTPLVRPLTVAPDKPMISRFNGCPRGILELLHSRACRSTTLIHIGTSPADLVLLGAIMFNDVLTVEQCEKLVSRLSRCSFPFQCAHGRPSMAPLIDLGKGAKFGGWQETERQKKPSWKSWIQKS
ncbi:Dna mismatch repair mlh3 [Fusarium acuminatum]|uniref:Dna mismatch repair mlh3 n=1 Tax=Fusarium acuminatum TaxID=5515 RepID=A0ABZ2WFX3_9HYPO